MIIMHKPPTFPDFDNLSLKYKDYIYQYNSQFDPYSDFNFVSMYSNDTFGLIQISMLNENFVVKLQDYITGEYFYTFIGINDALDTTITLINQSIENNLGNYIKLIPEFVVQSITLPTNYKIIEDLGDHDYICSTKEGYECRGPKYHTNKKSVNQFRRLYPNIEFNILDSNDTKIKKDIINLSETWRIQKNVSIEESHIELKAIDRIFDLIDVCNIEIGGLHDNDKLIAFVIFEILDKSYSIGHFGKFDRNYRGIYQYEVWSLFNYLYEINVELFNFEQDLGIDNLKMSKKHWNPVKYLKKYKIEKLI